MTTKMTLETMRFYAFHGVSEQERAVGGYYTCDLSYSIDTDATETDCLDDTADYAAMFDVVKAEMMQPSRLIEHLAGRIIKALRAGFAEVYDMTVTVAKLNPPVNGEADKATVTIKYTTPHEN